MKMMSRTNEHICFCLCMAKNIIAMNSAPPDNFQAVMFSSCSLIPCSSLVECVSVLHGTCLQCAEKKYIHQYSRTC